MQLARRTSGVQDPPCQALPQEPLRPDCEIATRARSRTESRGVATRLLLLLQPEVINELLLDGRTELCKPGYLPGISAYLRSVCRSHRAMPETGQGPTESSGSRVARSNHHPDRGRHPAGDGILSDMKISSRPDASSHVRMYPRRIDRRLTKQIFPNTPAAVRICSSQMALVSGSLPA